MKKVSIIILAAGKSKRMRSSKSKVLHCIADRPLLDFVNEIADKNSTSGVYYVCSPEVRKYILKNYKNVKTVIQKKQLGTAHAVGCAEKLINKKNNDAMILFGDVPLVKDSTIKKLIAYKNKINNMGVIVTFNAENPYGYGRVICEKRNVKFVVEESDASEKQKKIKLCNSGILICDSKFLFDAIKRISSDNNQKERFLTDICKIAYNQNNAFSFINCEETEVLGINSKKQLVELDLKFQKILKEKMIDKGVVLLQPDTIRVSYDTKISKGVVVEPNNVFKKNVEVQKSSKILAGSYLEGCTIGKNCKIGPFARIRPSTKISDKVKIGNFVEIKNSNIGVSSSVSHLSYIGDTLIGKQVNVGAGTITCNYDGIKKNQTIIEDYAFIGSNSSLIAPIRIGKNATVGAGSVITKNVPSGKLAIERSDLLILKKKKIKKVPKF